MEDHTQMRRQAEAYFNIGDSDLLDLLGGTGTHGDTSADENFASTHNNSGCDVPLAVSVFKDVKAQQIKPRQLTLRQLQNKLTGTTAPGKTALPLVKLGTFGEARTERGSLRHDANLLSVSGVEGDYDAGVLSPQEAADLLRQSGIAALIYTTPSHTREAPRWRVLAPLARQVAPAERAALCAKLNGALRGILAAESFTPSQSYYFGGVTGRPVETVLVEGNRSTASSELPRSARSRFRRSPTYQPIRGYLLTGLRCSAP